MQRWFRKSLLSFCATCVPSPGLAAGNHQFTLLAQGVKMETSLGSDVAGLVSPLGVSAGYAYRAGFSTALFLQYSLVLSGKQIFLRGASLGLDYAILGGQTRAARFGGESLYEFEFPYRLGLFLAVAERTYSFSEIVKGPSVSFKKKVPIEGDLVGAEAGLSFELPLSDFASMILRGSYIAPSFSDEAEQKGSLMCFAAGIGVLM